MSVGTQPVHARDGWTDGWYTVPYEIVFHDLDALGHVNNIAYLNFFEIARTRLWLRMTGQSGHHAIDFIVARTECNYRKQLSMGDQIDIGVRIENIRNSSFDFVYEIRRSSGRELAADGKATVVLFSFSENQKLKISDELREKIHAFQRGSTNGGSSNSDASGGSASPV